MVSLLNSQGMKAAKVENHSVYTNDWSTFLHVYWCYIFFFSEIPKYVQSKNRLAHLNYDFMKVG